MMYLYHNVLNIERLKNILDTGFIYKDISPLKCVCMSRNHIYLHDRGIRMIFDYRKLKNNYKIKPFCYIGWCKLNNHRFLPRYDEFEERVYNDIDVLKTCLRIDINANKYKNVELEHHLINYTSNFLGRILL